MGEILEEEKGLRNAFQDKNAWRWNFDAVDVLPILRNFAVFVSAVWLRRIERLSSYKIEQILATVIKIKKNRELIPNDLETILIDATEASYYRIASLKDTYMILICELN